MPPDLASIELTLRPRKFNRIPEWQGRAAQALFYSTLHRIHEMVSETIHDLHKWHPIMPKPFTMSTLTGAPIVGDMIALHPDRTVGLRLTTLHPHITGIVLNGVIPIWRREGFTIHDQPFVIQHVRYVKASYGDLLNLAGDKSTISLDFLSPTSFKQTGKGYLAQPLPEYVFSSLYNRWNSFVDTPLPESLRGIIQSEIETIHVDTQRRILSFARGKKGIIPGFYGNLTFLTRNTSPEVKTLLNALAIFASFSGVGIRTTVGMGQVGGELFQLSG